MTTSFESIVSKFEIHFISTLNVYVLLMVKFLFMFLHFIRCVQCVLERAGEI